MLPEIKTFKIIVPRNKKMSKDNEKSQQIFNRIRQRDLERSNNLLAQVEDNQSDISEISTQLSRNVKIKNYDENGESRPPPGLSPRQRQTKPSICESVNSVMSTASNNCPLCIEPMTYYGIGQCNHPICYKCLAKMRIKMEDISCPVCRNVCDDIFVDKEPGRKFENCSRRNYNFDRKYKMFFPKGDRKIGRMISELFAFYCLHEDCRHVAEKNNEEDEENQKNDNAWNASNLLKFPSLQKWQVHQITKHKSTPCDICIKNQALFSFEIVLYGKGREIKNHKDEQHPICEFCQQRFYDNDQLLRHLRKDHEYCRLCENLSFGAALEYYDNFTELRKHLVEEHYYCLHQDCNKNDSVYSVFKTELELNIHNKTEHQGDTSHKNRIHLDIHGLSDPKYNAENRSTNNPEGQHSGSNRQYASQYYTTSRENRDHFQGKIQNKNRDRYEDYPEASNQNLIPDHINDALESNQYEADETSFPTLAGQENRNQGVPEAYLNKSNLAYNPMNPDNFPTLGGVQGGNNNNNNQSDSNKKAAKDFEKLKKSKKSKNKSQTRADNFPELSQTSNPNKAPIPEHMLQKHNGFTPPTTKKWDGPKSSDKNDYPTLGSSSKKLPASMKKPNSMSLLVQKPVDAKTKLGSSGIQIRHTSSKSSKNNNNSNKNKHNKIKNQDPDWFAEDPEDDYSRFVPSNYNQNASNTSTGGLVNGLHPLAPKAVSKREDDDYPVISKQESYTSNSKQEFPSLGGGMKKKGNLVKTKVAIKEVPKAAVNTKSKKQNKQPVMNIIGIRVF